MSLSREKKAKLLAETAPAAKALVEDLAHIREVIATRATSNADIRRLSAVIRRILVDGDLSKIAVPRIGKLVVTGPDLKKWYKAADFCRLMFFAAGGNRVFGVDLHPIGFMNAGQGPQSMTAKAALLEALQEPSEGTATMRLDNFLSQYVLCLNGNWISRRTAIKHIANYGSGVHSKSPDSHDHQVCEVLRTCCTYSVVDGKVRVHVLPHLGKDSFDMTLNADPPWTEDSPTDILDPVLLEVLAAAAFIAASPGVHELEAIIALET